MKNLFFVFILFISCNSGTRISKEHFLVDKNEIDVLLKKISDSNIEAIKNEKVHFLNSNFKNDTIYLNHLNSLIEADFSIFNMELLKNELIRVYNSIESKNIDKLNILYVSYSGEMIYEKGVVIVEERNSYSPIMFVFSNSGKHNFRFVSEDRLFFFE